MRAQTARQFEGVLARYFERFLADVPTAAAAAGIRSAEGKLGQFGPSFHGCREKERRRALAALEAISPRELSNEQQMDRLALRALLLKESEDFARSRHTVEPSAPEMFFNAVLRELLRGDDQPLRAGANLRGLMKGASDFLGEAATSLRKPERVWLRVMHETVSGTGPLLEAVRALLKRPASSPAHADELLIRKAGEAVESYREKATRLPVSPPRSFALGREAMQRRLRDELGLDCTLGQVESLAQSEILRVQKQMAKACRQFGRGRKPSQILEEARRNWFPSKPLLELYQQESARVARRFQDSGAVSFPRGDELVLKPVPEFLRALIATAAYDAPGAFEKRQRGVFWVNDLGLAKSLPAEQLAERRQHFGIALTCAHEAYPGHHLQFVMANRHPRKWRRLFSHAVFYEGWTLWCEQMLIDLKIDSAPWLRVQQLHDALWRCHRILVDLRLQTGRYSWEEAAQHLRKHLGFTRSRAEAEANWYTTQPAVPMSYWLGRLENERLHRRLVTGRGWSLQRFNDWLLSFGTIPQAWIEKYGLD